MPRPCRQLDLDERRRIYRLVDARVPVATIAAGLGRHRSTVYREIRRNRVHLQPELRRYRFHEHAYFEGYFPITAQAHVAWVVREGVSAAVGFIEAQLEAGLLDGGVSRCKATTRKGKACQRTPLPSRDYCPSHQHLERTTLPARAAA